MSEIEVDPKHCPSCGYTKDDCALHRDHCLCSAYPFFQFEKDNTVPRRLPMGATDQESGAMSEGIEELIGELLGEISRTEHIMEGSGIQPYLHYSTGALTELLAHFDHLTAELARRQNQVETLRAACEAALTADPVFMNGSVRLACGDLIWAQEIIQSALAATAEPGGEGGGR